MAREVELEELLCGGRDQHSLGIAIARLEADVTGSLQLQHYFVALLGL